jgi:hypothetical protein
VNVHFAIPLETKLFLESFRFPSFGKFVHKIKANITDKYTFLHLALEGVKEGLLKNTIAPGDLDLKTFNSLRSLYGIVDSAMADVETKDTHHLHAIKENVSESILLLEEILKIVADKKAHQELKMNLHEASVDSLSLHLNKFNKAV